MRRLALLLPAALLALGCEVSAEYSAAKDRLDLLSDQLERRERAWNGWREQVVQELRRQDSLVAALTDSLADARVQLALARADRLFACAAERRTGGAPRTAQPSRNGAHD